MCVSFFSYYLASSLDSLVSQSASVYQILLITTEALICFSAMDYRNQIVCCLGSLVCGLFSSLSSGGPSNTLLVSTGKAKSPSVLQLPLHCHHCSRRSAEPQVSVMIRGWAGWLLSRALSGSTALEPPPYHFHCSQMFIFRSTKHSNSSTLAHGSSQKAQAAEELLLSLLSQYCQGRGINWDLVEMSWSTCCSIPMQSNQAGKLLEAKKPLSFNVRLQCKD